MKRRKSRTSKGKKRACPCLAIQTPVFCITRSFSETSAHSCLFKRPKAHLWRRRTHTIVSTLGIFEPRQVIPDEFRIAAFTRIQHSLRNTPDMHAYISYHVDTAGRGHGYVPPPPPGSAWLQLPGTKTGEKTESAEPEMKRNCAIV